MRTLDQRRSETESVEQKTITVWPLLVAAAALAILVFAVFHPILDYEFVNLDVPGQVVLNAHVHGLSIENVKQDLLLDIYPFVQADAEWKDSYTAGVWGAYAKGGKMYMSPMGTNYGSMFYNKNVLAKAGLSKPAEEWGDLMDYVRKIRATGIDPWLTGGKEY